MEENTSKMSLAQERRLADLQQRVTKLEDVCYTAKEVLTLEEAAKYLGVTRSMLYKLTHENRLPYFKPSGKLVFFEKKDLLDWVRSAKCMSEEEIKEEAARRLLELARR